jgi:hypothetical protein
MERHKKKNMKKTQKLRANPDFYATLQPPWPMSLHRSREAMEGKEIVPARGKILPLLPGSS